jgi:ribosomal protein S12 methylthiotransferase
MILGLTKGNYKEIMKKKNHKSPVTVGFVALGCPKNIVDSEVMLALLGQAGFVLGGNPDRADVVVINTCGFIAPAKEEAVEAIRRAVRQKSRGKVRKVVVAGCLSERMGQALKDEVKGIDAIVGLAQRDSIAQIIADCLSERELWREAVPGPHIHDDRGRLLITPGHWAYLRISEGCDRKCSFCTIPSIRGRFRSKPMELVLDEARELVQNGAVELSIIAQDSNYYGRDLKIENGLVKLTAEIEKLDGLQWIRLMYLYPSGINEPLLEAMAQSRKILHYADIPIQHINDRILKCMRRADTKENNLRLITRLRELIPDTILRTTVIVGYPGETEAEFEELLEFVQWAKFDALGCFSFYAEPGTPAAELDNQLPDAVKQERADRLMKLQQSLVFEKMDSWIGKTLTVLVDETTADGAIGRYYGQAPHIDSLCLIGHCDESPGAFIQARVVGRDGYDLCVEKIKC